VVRRINEHWEEGRVDAVLSLMHPDLDWLEPPETPDRAVVHGREQALSALMMWLSTWSTYENELREITENGEHVIVHFRQRMVGPSSGVPVEGDLFMVWTVRDGLATRMAMFQSSAEAEAEAGLA
jgi:ketosteroid isomerase-like protein